MANCIIAQSGGPTTVINASAAGLFRKNEEVKYFENVYAGINGIEGILNKKIINLSHENSEDIKHFMNTPSSGLGSCRYKMKGYEIDDSEYKKLVSILKEYNITTFFYIGGNDSMDTVAKLSAYMKENNISIDVIGIPKTIDNDLPITDHTPGFGSAAKLISTIALETYLDASVYTNNGIFILETMGRDTGWLAASACISKLYGHPVADFIYLPEVAFDEEKFIKDVATRFKEKNQVYIVASEGLRDSNGKFLSELGTSSGHDNFGHAQLGGVGSFLKSIIINSGITKRVKALELGVIQRCAMHLASKTDLDEAYRVGEKALELAIEGLNGYMAAIKRVSENPYVSETFPVEASKVANSVKYFPSEWINKDNNNVTEEAFNYIAPLIEGSVSLDYDKYIPKFKVFNK